MDEDSNTGLLEDLIDDGLNFDLSLQRGYRSGSGSFL